MAPASFNMPEDEQPPKPANEGESPAEFVDVRIVLGEQLARLFGGAGLSAARGGQ